MPGFLIAPYQSFQEHLESHNWTSKSVLLRGEKMLRRDDSAYFDETEQQAKETMEATRMVF